MDMLCLMFEGDRRGYLQAANGKPFSHEQIARMTGCSSEEVSHLTKELETSGVFSRTKHGVIYSRRQVRDEETRADNRSRQNKYRNQQKTNENSNGDITQSVTPLSHPSSPSVSKENKDSPPTPEEIYWAYPKHVGKQGALKAIRKTLLIRDPCWLMAIVQAYAETRVGKEEQYTPYPASWFNDGRYDDEDLQPKEKVLWTTMDGKPLDGADSDPRATD